MILITLTKHATISLKLSKLRNKLVLLGGRIIARAEGGTAIQIWGDTCTEVIVEVMSDDENSKGEI